MKKNKLPSLVVVLILTLITVIMWVSFNIYRSLTSKPSPSVPANISEPLTPSLDTQTISQISSRIYLNESQIPEVAPIIETSATPSATPELTPSPTPIPSPTPATESGTPAP